MALRSDSYGTVAEVVAYTRHLLDGATTYNSTTRPTATDVEKFIDRASGALNVALEGRGLTSPITNSTAKLICDDWVVSRAAMYTELTQRGTGYGGQEGSRIGGFKILYQEAQKFAAENALGFKRLGVGQQNKLSDGLAFTGQELQADRVDQDDTTLEQPVFTRHQFNITEEDD